MCAYTHVFTPLHLHVPTWDVQRRRKPCRGLGIGIPKSQTWGSSTNHAAGSAGLLVSHAGESWNNTSQDDAWRERDLGAAFSLILTPKRLLAKRPEWKKKKRKNIWGWVVFTKDCVSETNVYSRAFPLSRRFNFRAHTRGKSSIRPQRWIYIYSSTEKHATIITVANKNNSNSSPLPSFSLLFPFLLRPPTYFILFLLL